VGRVKNTVPFYNLDVYIANAQLRPEDGEDLQCKYSVCFREARFAILPDVGREVDKRIAGY